MTCKVGLLLSAAEYQCCLQTLLKGDHQSIQVDSLNFKAEVVETVDEFNDVLHTTWHPQGLLSRFLIAPREIDVRRLWR